MVTLILQFAACARAADLRISTPEIMDCLAMIGMIDILDASQFRRVLRANFAKSRREQMIFDRLYDLFFHEFQVTETVADAAAIAAPVAAIREQIRATAGERSEVAAIAEFIAGAPAAYLNLLQEIEGDGGSDRQGPGSNLGGLVRRFPVLRALARATEGIDHYLDQHRDVIHWETREQMRRHLGQRLALARDLLTRDAPAGPGLIQRCADRNAAADTVGDLSFNALSPAEMRRVQEAISRLVRKLRETTGLRQATRSRGALDVKRTLRRSARYQGIPIEAVHRNKPPRKARITVLCDISGSVWSSARFMLAMLYSLQTCFERVRSFVFVAEVAEVTRFFDGHDIARAIDKVFGASGVDIGASTDYGLTLRRFRDRHMDAIDKRTTVIVIGDGRSNYANPETAILAGIRERSRRLIWLNPETEAFWYSGDSEMRSYQAICNEVRPCRNLNQLSAFIKELVL